MSLIRFLRDAVGLLVFAIVFSAAFARAGSASSLGTETTSEPVFSEEELALKEAGILAEEKAAPALAGFEAIPKREPAMDEPKRAFSPLARVNRHAFLLALVGSIFLLFTTFYLGAKLRARRWSHKEFVQPELFSLEEDYEVSTPRHSPTPPPDHY